jgi:hypothetical protein
MLALYETFAIKNVAQINIADVGPDHNKVFLTRMPLSCCDKDHRYRIRNQLRCLVVVNLQLIVFCDKQKNLRGE